jgi:DNA adenine methylase
VTARPFLKWTGGKQWLAPTLSPYLRPPPGRSYFEPFLGGGAMFFAVDPRRAVVSDANAELIAAYCGVRDSVERVIDGLESLKNNERTYNRLKRAVPESRVDRAVRLIYLNKTAFNGIYRVNGSGGFNVPFGNYANPTICQAERLRAASQALRGASLRTCDFGTAIRAARARDVVYFVCRPSGG